MMRQIAGMENAGRRALVVAVTERVAVDPQMFKFAC